MRADIVPGSVFPDYELSDHPATRRKLSELQGQHPMVLARFIREGAESGLWGDQITPNIMAWG